LSAALINAAFLVVAAAAAADVRCCCCCRLFVSQLVSLLASDDCREKNKLNTSTNTIPNECQSHPTNEPHTHAQRRQTRQPSAFPFQNYAHTQIYKHTRGNVCSSSSSSSFSRVRTHNFPLLMIQIVYWISSCLLSFIFIYISRFVSFYVYGLFRKQFAAPSGPPLILDTPSVTPITK